MRANDAITGIVLILLSSLMIALTASFPDFPGQKYGPALFPRLLGGGLIICGMLLVWNGVAARRTGGRWLEVAPWMRDPRRLSNFLLIGLLLVVYIAAADTVGFIPIAFAFLAILLLWLGTRALTAIVIAAVTTLAIYWFFATLLRVPLPRGWLDPIL